MKISVVMATHNGATYLNRQISSVLDQTLYPDEIVVCDDRSSDSTIDILEKYQQSGLITYLSNKEQLGVIRNFKKGVSLAEPGNWISLCDQDDEWIPVKIEKSASLLAKINEEDLPCMVYSDLILIDETGEVLNSSFRSITGNDKYRHNLHSLLYFNFVTGCTVLMNKKARELYENMPDDVRSHDEWIALIVFTFGKAQSLDTPTVRYRKHDNNVSMPETKFKSRFKNLLSQSFKAIKGDDDFLKDQLEVVSRFYNFYKNDIPKEQKKIFDEFLKLKGKSYLQKKIAYRQMVKQNSLQKQVK